MPQELSPQNDNHEAALELEDLEQAARENRPPKPAQRYRVRVDKEHYEFDTPAVTGAEILARAGKTPEQWRLQLRERGATYREIGPDEVVDLLAPGLERFVTIPREQTDGAA
jgi:hypothetical protein